MIVKHLMEKYPTVDAQLFLGKLIYFTLAKHRVTGSEIKVHASLLIRVGLTTF